MNICLKFTKWYEHMLKINGMNICLPDQSKTIPIEIRFSNFLYLHIHFLHILSCKIKGLDLWVADLESTCRGKAQTHTKSVLIIINGFGNKSVKCKYSKCTCFLCNFTENNLVTLNTYCLISISFQKQRVNSSCMNIQNRTVS